MTFFIGLLLTVCYIPGVTSASIPTQWAVLSIFLPATLWRAGNYSALHTFGLIFVAWACLTAAWATNSGTSILGIWTVALWALGFWFGATRLNLSLLFLGMALGLTVSVGVAVAQALGYHPVELADAPGHYPGLLYSHVVQAGAIVLVLIACLEYQIWLFVPPLALGLVLANSRGAYLVLVATLLAKLHWALSIAAIFAFAILAEAFLNPSDSVRLQVWGYAIRGLSFAGWGPNSFHDVYYFWHDKYLNTDIFFRGEYVHNDYLQLWFEYGLGALAVYAIWALALSHTASQSWPILFAFSIMSLFYFPLYHPLTAFIGTVCAGHILRYYDPIRAYRDRWRPNIISWSEYL